MKRIHIILVILFFTTHLSYAQSTTIIPQKAFDYYNEVGVCIHLSWDTSIYYTHFDDIIYPALQKLGIKNIRTPLPYSSFIPLADTLTIKNRIIKLHDSLGIKMCFLLSDRQVADTPRFKDSADYLSVLENSSELLNATKYLEGYNEPDMNIYNWYPDKWDTLTYSMQQGLYKRTKSGTLSSIPILSPSFIEYWTTPSRTNQIAEISPHISTFCDYANFHTYDTGIDSTTMFPGTYHDITAGRLDTIRHSKPWVITEAGYENAKYWNLPFSGTYAPYGNHYLSELATAKYYSVLFMEMFGRGAKSIYTYEFIDENTTDSANDQMNFGLLHTNGTEKPAFTVIKNTLQLFKDTSAVFQPNPLQFIISGDTTGIKYALYQKFNGDYLIALWQGRSKGICYDFFNFTDLAGDSQSVQITFPFQYDTAYIYSPLISTQPLFSYTGSNVLNLNIPNNLLVVTLKAPILAIPAVASVNYQYHVFPNPANNTLYIDKQLQTGEKFFIYTLEGKVAELGVYDNGISEIDCSTLPPGLFILKLQNPNGCVDLITKITIIK